MARRFFEQLCARLAPSRNRRFSSAKGKGTAAHLPLMHIFKDAPIIEIPTRGSRDRIPALLGGHIDAGIFTLLRAGKFRLLVVFNDKRYSDLPDIPDLGELGYTEAAKLKAYNGLYIHKATPQKIKQAVIDACKKTYDDPEFKKGLQNFGEEVIFGSPEYFQKTIDDAREVATPLIKELGLYIEK